MPRRKRLEEDESWNKSCYEKPYAGKPVFHIKISDDPEEVRTYAFGLWKARLILDHITEISLFVDKYRADKKEVPDGTLGRSKSSKSISFKKGQKDWNGRPRSRVEPDLPKD